MSEIGVLLTAAVALGVGHTLIGPDHYVPFVAMSAARGWSARKTALITMLCGIGHVISSVLIGFVGIALGKAVGSLELLESARGQIAAWMMISFGAVYMVWGIRKAWLRRNPGADSAVRSDSIVPWVLFLVFAFGPCEPLIPLLIYPAVAHSLSLALLVSGVFGLATVSTMTAVVLGASFGLKKSRLDVSFRFGHAVAGAAIMVSGMAVQFLGL
jgi:sulfite exporter TauE/SafE